MGRVLGCYCISDPPIVSCLKLTPRPADGCNSTRCASKKSWLWPGAEGIQEGLLTTPGPDWEELCSPNLSQFYNPLCSGGLHLVLLRIGVRDPS